MKYFGWSYFGDHLELWKSIYKFGVRSTFAKKNLKYFKNSIKKKIPL